MASPGRTPGLHPCTGACPIGGTCVGSYNDWRDADQNGGYGFHDAANNWWRLADLNISDLRSMFATVFPGAGVTGRKAADMRAAMLSGNVDDAPTSARSGARSVMVGARSERTKYTAESGPAKATEVEHDAKEVEHDAKDGDDASDGGALAAVASDEGDDAGTAEAMGTPPSMGEAQEDRVRQIAREEDEARPLPSVSALAKATTVAVTTLQKRVDAVVVAQKAAVPRVRAIKVAEQEATPLPDTAHPALADIIHCASQGEYAYLVGPAGTGKSFMTEQAAAALGLTHAFMSWGPTTPLTALFGYKDANGNYHRTPFRDAYEHGHWWNNDEVDNGHPGLVTSMNTALAGSRCAFPDGMVDKHDAFYCSSCANTHGRGADRNYVGTNALNGSFLDRFGFIAVDYDDTLETALVERYANGEHADAVRAWHDRVRRVRDYCASNRVPFIVSMRASEKGARLIASGMDPERVAQIRILDRCGDQDLRDTLAAL